jgi:hypothetical protein
MHAVPPCPEGQNTVKMLKKDMVFIMLSRYYPLTLFQFGDKILPLSVTGLLMKEGSICISLF